LKQKGEPLAGQIMVAKLNPNPSQVVRQVFGGVMLKCGALMDQVGIV
jgi:hypothetical protein